MAQLDETAIKAVIARNFPDQSNRFITPARARELYTDMAESFAYLPTPGPAQFRNFFIVGQDEIVDDGFALTGTKTFQYAISDITNATGTVTITQDAVNITTTGPLAGPTVDATVNDVTFTAGQVVTFEASANESGVGTFSRQFTITARTADDYMYYGSQVSSNPATFDFANETRTPFIPGSQSFVLPTWAGQEHVVITQKASEPSINSVDIAGVDQFGGFTLTKDAFLVNSQQFDALVSNRSLDGSVMSGRRVTVGRG